jgi:hypothetical protein
LRLHHPNHTRLRSGGLTLRFLRDPTVPFTNNQAERDGRTDLLRDVLRAVKAATMIAAAAGVKVLVATKPVVFRRGADSLAAVVR